MAGKVVDYSVYGARVALGDETALALVSDHGVYYDVLCFRECLPPQVLKRMLEMDRSARFMSLRIPLADQGSVTRITDFDQEFLVAVERFLIQTVILALDGEITIQTPTLPVLIAHSEPLELQWGFGFEPDRFAGDTAQVRQFAHNQNPLRINGHAARIADDFEQMGEQLRYRTLKGVLYLTNNRIEWKKNDV